MFGPYQVTRDGRVWHGGVRLKEHHLAGRDGAHCLFLVREMVARPVSAGVARAAARLRPGFSGLVPDGQMRALREGGLVAEERAGQPATACGGGLDSTDGLDATGGRAAPPPPRVVHLVLALAQTCNLRCVYCLGGDGGYGHPGMMSEETALDAVDWLMESSGDAPLVRVSFAGGEPLLALPLLRRVVATAREQAATRDKAVSFSLTTNGTLLTDRVVAFLSDEGFGVTVSFDGPAAVQDRQRPFRNGRGSYRRVRGSVRRLLAAMPGATAQATVCPGVDPFTVRRALEEAGFRDFALNPASPVLPRRPGAPEATHEDAGRMLAYRRAEVAGLLAAVRDRRLERGSSRRELALLARLATGRRDHAACAVGRGVAAVAANGDVYPCPSFLGLEDARLGHLDDCLPDDVVARGRATVEDLPLCRACWARYLCGGGCSYENRARTGDERRPDPRLCRETLAVCDDLIEGWCRLTGEERAYVREQTEKTERRQAGQREAKESVT